MLNKCLENKRVHHVHNKRTKAYKSLRTIIRTWQWSSKVPGTQTVTHTNILPKNTCRKLMHVIETGTKRWGPSQDAELETRFSLGLKVTWLFFPTEWIWRFVALGQYKQCANTYCIPSFCGDWWLGLMCTQHAEQLRHANVKIWPCGQWKPQE